MTQKLRIRASSAIAPQIRVSRARSPSAGRALNVAPFEEPERDAAEHERVEGENDERVSLVGKRPAGEATRAADPSGDVPDEEEIGDVLEPAEEVREERDDELLREVVTEPDRHPCRGRSREDRHERRESEVWKGRAPRLPEREPRVGPRRRRRAIGRRAGDATGDQAADRDGGERTDEAEEGDDGPRDDLR